MVKMRAEGGHACGASKREPPIKLKLMAEK
jgi:hypothetical protein